MSGSRASNYQPAIRQEEDHNDDIDHDRDRPRHPTQWESQQHNEHLQIRIVPYSPPRMVPDSPSPSASRPASRLDFESRRGRTKEPWTKFGVSDCAGNTSTSEHHYPDFENTAMSSQASSPSCGSASTPTASHRRKRVISINSDNKTFSLHPQSAADTSSIPQDASFGSYQISSITPSSSWGRVSSNPFMTEDRTSSPLTGRLSSSPSISPSMLHSQRLLSGDDTSPIQPCQVTGSVYQMDQTRFRNEQAVVVPGSPTTEARKETFFSLDADPVDSIDGHHRGLPSSPRLSGKDSFHTDASGSDSVLSERTNYKIYAQSSPICRVAKREAPELEKSPSPSSSDSDPNYRVLGESSPETQSISDPPRLSTLDSEANFVILGGSSAACSSRGTSRSRLRSEYSRESLRVAPLRPARQRRSIERIGNLNTTSGESLRRGPLATPSTHETARALFAGASSACGSEYTQRSAAYPTASIDGPPAVSHAHQWSRPLSTVISESEGASLSPTRSASGFSALSTGNRKSSILDRNLLSMSSSLAVMDERLEALVGLRNCSPELPSVTYPRSHAHEMASAAADADEEEEQRDALGDLQDLHHRPSRTRLGNTSADRLIRSSNSTRTLNPFSIPTWARVYYGGGDRRFLIAQASSESMRSLYNGSMYNDPPYTSFLRPSPSAERFSAAIQNSSRRRPRDAAETNAYDIAAASTAVRPISTTMDPSPPPSRMRSIVRGVRRQTSSIWSPHLRRDRRASKFSMWDPPSAVWSTGSGFDWRRNQQIVLFVLGFIVPFAWMVAAFLPLPPNPHLKVMERSTQLHAECKGGHLIAVTLEEFRYNSARWWRNLNRGMSVIGLLLIGAAVALIAVGLKQGWST